jgi:hypothetical protein
MPELMTKQDAIEYLLYMKNDVQAKSPMDIALDTEIEALKQPTIEAEPVRHGRWLVHTTWHGMFGLIHSECSECKFDRNGDLSSWKFCPNCGSMNNVSGKGGADNG